MYTGNLGKFVQGLDILCKVINQINRENIQWVFIGEGRSKGKKMMKLLSEEIKKNEL